MNSQFTQRVSDVIQYSKEEANRLRNSYIGPEHLLLGLIREGEGKAIQILQSLYVDLKKVKKALEDVLRESSDTTGIYIEEITFNDKASKILRMSILEARLLKSPLTDTEHMLLAIMREDHNKASDILEENEVT
ncbi:Clp protease N-terminal domain-containing protein, partial [uncultured Bacteroides sp.]